MENVNIYISILLNFSTFAKVYFSTSDYENVCGSPSTNSRAKIMRNVRNKIMAMNTWAVALLRYGAQGWIQTVL